MRIIINVLESYEINLDIMRMTLWEAYRRRAAERLSGLRRFFENKDRISSLRNGGGRAALPSLHSMRWMRWMRSRLLTVDPERHAVVSFAAG